MLATLLLLLFIPLWKSLIEPLSEVFGKTAWSMPRGSDGSSIVAGGLVNLFVQVGSGAVSLFGSVVGALKSVTPSYVAPIKLPSLLSFVVIPLILLSAWFYIKGNALRDDIRERARNIWKPSTAVPQSSATEAVVESRFRIIRLMRNFKDWMQKRKLRPGQFAGQLAVVAGFGFITVVCVIGLSRLAFNLQMGSGRICTATDVTAVQWFGSKECDIRFRKVV